MAGPQEVVRADRPFFISAMVNSRGRPHRVSLSSELPNVSQYDEQALVDQCREDARQFGGTYYVYEVRPVRRVTRRQVKQL